MAALVPAEQDPGYGTDMLLRGRIIAGCLSPTALDCTPDSRTLTEIDGAGTVRTTEIWGYDDIDRIQFGDPTGIPTDLDEKTTHGDPGYIFLGSQTFARGGDTIMVPNNLVLSAAIVPLREPSSVDLRARLRPGVMPSTVQDLLEHRVSTPVRSEPHIGLEEVDADEVVMRIAATPVIEADGPKLADEILAAIAPVTRDGSWDEHPVPDDAGRRPADRVGQHAEG